MAGDRQAASGWRSRVERIREEEDERGELDWQEYGFGYQGASPWEYEEAMRLKDALVRKFQGMPLEEAIPGEAIQNRFGACYHMRTCYPTEFKTLNPGSARANILSSLRLVYGIGQATEAQLKEEGWFTLKELLGHSRWGEGARSLLELLDHRNTKTLQEWVWHWFPKSHPLAFSLTGLHQAEELVLVDIETLGLFGRATILLGIARPRPDGLEVRQWLVRSMREERAALSEFWSAIGEGTAVISYNGRAFDIPAVEERFGYYGEVVALGAPHFDLLHFSRRAWGGKLPDCRLGTLESHLLRERRTQDVPSALVPQFYQTYLETRNVGPLSAIVAHNRQDLVSLARIFSKLCDEWEDQSS